MEKTSSTVKGSTSAAAEVIAVDVNPKALCCPRCLHLLAPPVLQCAAGHLICSSCHDNLPDKNKCISCFIPVSFIPTSYSRCHAVEGILRSVRLDCPNTIHGCAAEKMLCHEMAEHQNKCSFKAVLQRNASVLKMGPCGANDSDNFEMEVGGIDHIVKVVVWHGYAVDAMKVVYKQDGKEKTTPTWGQPAIKRSEICLESDEYLTCVKGYIADYTLLCVTSLTFISNRRTFGPYGEEIGKQFELPAAPGGRIIGFHGRADEFLDALVTYVKMDE